MTVKELREKLEFYPDDSDVMFSYCYGDYGRTEVAESITDIDMEDLTWNENLRMFSLEEDLEEEPFEDEEPPRKKLNVCILR